MQTTQYQWRSDSPIQRIEIREFESGLLEAYVHAPQNTPAGALSAVPEHLGNNGWQAVSDELEGQSVLRVTGFKSEKELFNALNDVRAVNGQPQKSIIGEKEQVSFVDRMRKRTVNLAGFSGLIGHGAMAVAGALENDYKRVATSAFYGASTSIQAFKGAGDASGQFRKMTEDMRTYLDAHGVDIPVGKALTAEELGKKGGVLDKVTDFWNEHPIQISNAIGLVGNLFMMASGRGEMKNEKSGDKDGIGRAMSGAASMMGALAIILIPEKQKEKPKSTALVDDGSTFGTTAPVEEKEEEKSGLASLPKKAFEWVREKPMRFAGIMFMSSNIAMVLDAQQIHKKYKGSLAGLQSQLDDVQNRIDTQGVTEDLLREQGNLSSEYSAEKRASYAVPFAATTAATYLTSGAFTAISSKEAAADYTDKEMTEKLCAYSANVVAFQPEDVRDRAVYAMASYLSDQPNVMETKQDLIVQINDKVDKISQGPWAAKVEAQKAVAAAAQQNGAAISGPSA